MLSQRTSRGLQIALIVTGFFSSLSTSAQTSRETAALSEQEGSWSVVDTFKAGPDMAPEVSKGLVAERRMVGSFLEETLHTSETSRPLRIDYLGYDTTAGQWRYVSIEARILVAPMSASSFARDTPERITVRFEPFAAPPVAPGWAGRMLRMEEVITRDGPDHETKDQYFILADGTARPWLAHRYDYRRLH
ncbi:MULTISPECIES: hypothetical protein [Paraburkholderia]|jgi:hypothetical protein|uniref:hypothetical protein n=1 Tax=Paraburkholderia TaxID=1822464 RepID=UPI00225B1828|nr:MULTISPECIES: hypothetical protein [Paraburkholderia]MCX4155416.1 hypothetical protein [Paraburkholderia aspalathi]MDN7164825.1 hypothetical protein [Paraburkholderia sp. SECH2]MDQ6393311.1 hypothetical protein [Paraburkholderia aspalathi]